MSKSKKDITIYIITNVCRMTLAATFIFSGFVKANDPLGTVYKLEDYFTAWGIGHMPQTLTLAMALVQAIVEWGLGVYLLLGMRRRLITIVTLIFMAIMTLFTVYIAIYNPVSDCGCFGDAIILTNTQTLLKNILLLACAVVTFRYYKTILPIISRQASWIATTLAMVGIVIYAAYCIYTQPLIDFRPYKVGTDLRSMLDIPTDQRPQFEVTLIYQRNGETLEISIDDDDPDSTWTYVETRRKEIQKAGPGIAADFKILDADDNDITTYLLDNNEYVILLTAPILPYADQSTMGRINDLYDYAVANDIPFVALTASSQEARNRWIDYTGAEYNFYTSDERELKTVVRANPGLVVIHNGVITGKWSNWNMPDTDEITNIITKPTKQS